MKSLVPWAAVFLAGVVLGVAGMLLSQSFTDAALQQRKTELIRLTSELHEKESALAAGQSRLSEQTTAMRQVLTRAGDLSKQVMETQGSAIDRLKKVIGILLKLQNELKSFN